MLYFTPPSCETDLVKHAQQMRIFIEECASEAKETHTNIFFGIFDIYATLVTTSLSTIYSRKFVSLAVVELRGEDLRPTCRAVGEWIFMVCLRRCVLSVYSVRNVDAIAVTQTFLRRVKISTTTRPKMREAMMMMMRCAT